MYIINYIDGNYCVINTLSNLLVAKFIKLEDATNFIQAANTINFGFPNNMNKFSNTAPQNVPVSRNNTRIKRTYDCCSHGKCQQNHNKPDETMIAVKNMSEQNKILQKKLRDLNSKINSVIEEKTAILNENEILKSIIVNSDDDDDEIIEKVEVKQEFIPQPPIIEEEYEEDENEDEDEESEDEESEDEESEDDEDEDEENESEDDEIIENNTDKDTKEVELETAEKVYLNRENVDTPKSKKELKKLKKEQKKALKKAD
ncbi:hypothetical protein [Spiroplasma endosymbiont of Cantharis lateralis]|uniref:hypothetical protein n=1 Tax=Spiroplasma endosymbiont of Cantharis lateralis TaxID=3066277 RepID=UPI00313B6E12